MAWSVTGGAAEELLYTEMSLAWVVAVRGDVRAWAES